MMLRAKNGLASPRGDSAHLDPDGPAHSISQTKLEGFPESSSPTASAAILALTIVRLAKYKDKTQEEGNLLFP